MKNLGRWLRGLIGAAAIAVATLSASAEPTTLRLVCWEGAEALLAVRNAAAEFEKAHPNIHVKVENAPFGNYHEKLLAQYAAGVAPDVSLMNPENFQRYAKRGALLPLSDFISNDPQFDLSAYYKPICDAMSLDGKLYVLARDIAPIGLIYINKGIFRKAGLKIPDGTWTWDYKPRPELREKCFTWVMQQLTKKDADGKVTQFAFSPGWPGAFIDLMVYSQGARYADDNAHPTQTNFTDPRIVNAYKFFSDLCYEDKWVPSPSALSTEMMMSTGDLFIQGRVAMFQSGIWEVPNLRKRMPTTSKNWFDWDIVMAPAYKDGTLAMPTGGSGYCVFSSTKHPQESWELIKWMAGPPAMKILAAAGLAQPAIKALASQPPWTVGPNTPVEERYPASRIITDQAVPHVVFEPTADYWPEVKSFSGQSIDKVVSGTAEAEPMLKEAQQRSTDRLKQLLQTTNLPDFPWALGGVLAVVVLGGLFAWVFLPERGKKLTAKQKHEARAAYWMMSPWIIGLLCFTVGPMIFSVLTSFSDWDIIQPAKWRGVQNFSEAFTDDPRFWVSLKITFIYTIVAVPLGIVASLCLALLLNVKVKGMPLYRTCFYIPSLASGVASALIWRAVFKADGGLLNAVIYGANGKGNLLGLGSLLSSFGKAGEPINWLGNEHTALASLILMSLWGAGGGMVVLLAGLQGIPQFYYEAAVLDGAGAWRKFTTVTLPMLGPALMFTLITGLIGSFQVFTNAFVMTAGGPGESTMFYMLHLYNNAFVNLRMGYASALAWILFVIVLGLTVIQLRFNKRIYYEAGGGS